MPIVNYVKEHKRFIEYASDEQLSGAERLLWYALMHIFNQRAQGHVWPDGYIKATNDRVLSLFPGQRDALFNARNKLKQRGLIDFIPGDRNKKTPMYKINYFFPQDAEETSEEDGDEETWGDWSECWSEKTTNPTTKTPTNFPTNPTTKTPTIYINNKDKEKHEPERGGRPAPALRIISPQFQPPSLEEVSAYCREKGYKVNAKRFVAVYNGNGWMDKKGVPVLDWKSKVDSWAELPFDRMDGGKRVSEQEYTQRNYTEEELLAVSDDLIEVARQHRKKAQEAKERGEDYYSSAEP